MPTKSQIPSVVVGLLLDALTVASSLFHYDASRTKQIDEIAGEDHQLCHPPDDVGHRSGKVCGP